MKISELEAVNLIQYFTKANSFIAKQVIKLLATSTELLEFPFPYENITMMPTTHRNEFTLTINDASKEEITEREKLIEGILWYMNKQT